MMSPEAHEKKAIKKYLDSTGVWYFSPYMAGFGKAGVPDIIVNMWGKFVAIEVKREGKKPTPIQERMLQEINATEGLAIWGTAEKVIAELKNAVR